MRGHSNAFAISRIWEMVKPPSAGMLRQAQAKFRQVPVEKVGLQELFFQEAFDGITCIDAMENVFPEDWPGVLRNFHRTLKPHGLLYFTVEIPEDELPTVFQVAVEAGLPVVGGEWAHDGAYHYYPAMEQVKTWVNAAGFCILEEAEDGDYNAMIVRKMPC